MVGTRSLSSGGLGNLSNRFVLWEVHWCRGFTKGRVRPRMSVVVSVVDPPLTVEDLAALEKSTKQMMRSGHIPLFGKLSPARSVQGAPPWLSVRSAAQWPLQSRGTPHPLRDLKYREVKLMWGLRTACCGQRSSRVEGPVQLSYQVLGEIEAHWLLCELLDLVRFRQSSSRSHRGVFPNAPLKAFAKDATDNYGLCSNLNPLHYQNETCAWQSTWTSQYKIMSL